MYTSQDNTAFNCSIRVFHARCNRFNRTLCRDRYVRLSSYMALSFYEGKKKEGVNRNEGKGKGREGKEKKGEERKHR